MIEHQRRNGLPVSESLAKLVGVSQGRMHVPISVSLTLTPETTQKGQQEAHSNGTAAKKRKSPKEKKPRVPSILEKRFKELWNGPDLVEEFRFHPTRKWRADFAHLETKTLIEVEGGIYSNGRHNRASGFKNDSIKYLEAALLGYRVIRLTSPQLTPETLIRVAAAVRGWMQELRNNR